MTIEQNIIKIIPGMQAASLVNYNLKYVPKFNMKQSNFNMKKPIKNMVKLTGVNLVGVGMIKSTSEIVNSI